MRLGLLGGTFDPIHVGHLLLAEQCREQCQLDEVWFLPAGNPPHKLAAEFTPGKERAEMLSFAIAGHPQFSVSRIELERSGTTYTVDTLEQLRDEDPTRELFFLLGADSLDDLPNWREPQRIAELATLVVANRGDRPLPHIDELRDQLGGSIIAKLRFVEIPGIDLSARDIRRRVRENRSIRFMTPRAIEAYIAEHRLYVG